MRKKTRTTWTLEEVAWSLAGTSIPNDPDIDLDWLAGFLERDNTGAKVTKLEAAAILFACRAKYHSDWVTRKYEFNDEKLGAEVARILSGARP